MDPFMETKERIIRLQLPGGILDLSQSFYSYNEGKTTLEKIRDMAIELKRGTQKAARKKKLYPHGHTALDITFRM